MEIIPQETIISTSIGRLVHKKDNTNYPMEFVNSLQPPGFPAHKLRLKVGSTVMFLRNLEPPKLSNGTRLFINKFKKM